MMLLETVETRGSTRPVVSELAETSGNTYMRVSEQEQAQEMSAVGALDRIAQPLPPFKLEEGPGGVGSSRAGARYRV